MKTDIVLAGVGGQGILSIAAAIGLAAIKNNLYLKQSEVHGMSQRGGAVYSHLRLSDKEIASDLIPFATADIILSVEPMESLRYLPYLGAQGWVVTNTTPFININNYPEPATIIKEIENLHKHVLLDADAIAEKAGSNRSSNMVMLGAASPFIEITADIIEAAITDIFKRKGDSIVEVNLKAFREGRNVSLQKIK
jgi:indolepyruvate ferredoxin oxidoreductase, beta subunit